MLHKNENYAFKQPDCSNNDTFEACNLSQLQPNTDICAGKTGLTFNGCNLLNCRVPDGSTVQSCNTVQKSFCYWLHEEWTLPVEPENCSHVVELEEVIIDGQAVDSEYRREDKVL